MQVIIHNAVSIDGRLTGFEADLATYYRLAGMWQEDATLCGSGTILAAPEGRKRERAGSSWSPKSGDTRPLLAIAVRVMIEMVDCNSISILARRVRGRELVSDCACPERDSR